MVDAFECRLGNIIRLYLDDSNYNDFPLELPDFNLLARNQQNRGVYAPVPLTDKIIKDCGFHAYDDGEFVHPLFSWFVVKFEPRFNGYKLTALSAKYQAPLQYLHQLQNLFYVLTRTEIVYSPTSIQ
jgi:hypothetical protein